MIKTTAMEKYTLSRSEEQPSVCPFTFLPKDTPQIRVKDGSKIRNLLRFALSRMDPKTEPKTGSRPGPGSQPGSEEPGQEQKSPDQTESRAGPESRCVVFTALGKAASKAITCAEIVKRRVPGLHQVTQLSHSSILDSWDPLDPGLGLDSLTVTRKSPCIWIVLSAAPLDRCTLGYQTPGRHDDLWANQEPGAWPRQCTNREAERGEGAGPGHTEIPDLRRNNDRTQAWIGLCGRYIDLLMYHNIL
uniref:DNA/RNA-binding protein Alba-like domain-containing protein n=1 Tax=Neogobius melanostomus TaxID=47308 RepID=A0A8C6U6H9_9GOBI